MACFHVIYISIISSGNHVVLTTFCGDYPCVHYFYVPWLVMTSQWVMMLLKVSHCGITVGNVIARDIHCDITMGNGIAMCTYHGITMHNEVAMYYYAKLWYCCPVDSWNFPTQKRFTWTPQSDHSLTCSCYNTFKLLPIFFLSILIRDQSYILSFRISRRDVWKTPS